MVGNDNSRLLPYFTRQLNNFASLLIKVGQNYTFIFDIELGP